MKAAFKAISLLAVALMVSGFFFVQISQGATGQIAEIFGFGKDAIRLGGRLLLPLGLVFMFIVFARSRL